MELIEGHRSGEFGGHIKEVLSKIKGVLWNIKEGLPNVIRHAGDFPNQERFHWKQRVSEILFSC